ncbi:MULTISPECIES: hypothetical protein [Pseudomonas]|uniref:Uncharacterized protein n=1 Tax=Pseudomonas fluorescens TaxID=294 RepID=A0A5E6U7B3_PSEFL|nr:MULTISPECIES: hypothetical protein [Pseudomonas]VVN01442.1 hypothetical protein PS652_03319 [Pseudomonas fluorescens]
MLTRTLLASLLLLGPLNAHAFATESQPRTVLLELGAQLAHSAGSSQWQQLWQRTRQAGYLQSSAQALHFDVPQTQIPALVASTLASADEVLALKQTQVRYRRDFHPRIIGKAGAHEMTALCLWVDWRSLPEHGISRPTSYLAQVSLLLARPCE